MAQEKETQINEIKNHQMKFENDTDNKFLLIYQMLAVLFTFLKFFGNGTMCIGGLMCGYFLLYVFKFALVGLVIWFLGLCISVGADEIKMKIALLL